MNIIKIFIITTISISSTSYSQTEPILPLPLTQNVNAKKAELGNKLFHDKRLSTDNSTSCATCHDLANKFGTDLTRVSTGVGGKRGTRNSPTVYNSVFNFKQFWDGRSDTLQDQARLPVTNPVEMGMGSWKTVIDKLAKDPDYVNSFNSIYNGEITEDRIVDSIAEFEKTLVMANSKFDQYLRGDENAITEQQKKGYSLFKSYGCVSCHQGQNVGGNMFQKFGVLKDINLQQSSSLSNDLGRYEVTKNEWDKRVFKVPSLRLAVKTPPYFHDGSVKTIQEAVSIMIEFQLGRDVPSEDKDAIISFLESLVGELPKGVK